MVILCRQKKNLVYLIVGGAFYVALVL